MSGMPPLLIDTTSLLRANLDSFHPAENWDADRHASTVIQSLILFERVLLDGPSIERNSQWLQWLAEIPEDIEILDLSRTQQASLYLSAEVLAGQMHSTPEDVDFMRMHMPNELGAEIASRHSFVPSTYWEDLDDGLGSEDLQRLYRVFNNVFAPNIPFSGAAFVALARTLYYLCLQESVRSSLLLDPLKALEAPDPAGLRGDHARRILEMFDSDVGEAFRARKMKWLGAAPRTLRPPLLSRYIQEEARRRGWSIGRVILWMRESRDVRRFREGLSELQDAVDRNDSRELDAIFADLDAAAAAWSKHLGSSYGQRGDIDVSVSLPFVGLAKKLPLPRLTRRSASTKLLVFVGELLAAA